MITNAERTALSIVDIAIRAGKIVDVSPPAILNETGKFRVRTSKLGFNMITSGSGNCACIGGWTWVAMQKPDLNEPTLNLDAMYDYVFHDSSLELDPLYFPGREMTAMEAADAIAKFLA